MDYIATVQHIEVLQQRGLHFVEMDFEPNKMTLTLQPADFDNND